MLQIYGAFLVGAMFGLLIGMSKTPGTVEKAIAALIGAGAIVGSAIWSEYGNELGYFAGGLIVGVIVGAILKKYAGLEILVQRI